MGELNGKVALVTGARRGLGFEIAKGLAAAGAAVIMNGRDAAPLQAAVDAIIASGGRAAALPLDITDHDEVRRRIGEIVARYGHIDILVNNAALRDRRELFGFAVADVERLLTSNLTAPFHLSREVAKAMIEKGEGGRIINVT